MTPWYRERPLAAGALLLVAAVVVAGWTVWRAVRLDPLPRSERKLGVVTLALEVGPADTMSDERFAATLDRDPFHPERRRPTEAFQIAADPAPAAPSAEAPVAPAPAAPTIRLVGTVVTPGGDAFAMCQLGSEPPKVVRPGGRLGEYTLQKVEQGRAVFRSASGETVDLHAPKAGTSGT